MDVWQQSVCDIRDLELSQYWEDIETFITTKTGAEPTTASTPESVTSQQDQVQDKVEKSQLLQALISQWFTNGAGIAVLNEKLKRIWVYRACFIYFWISNINMLYYYFGGGRRTETDLSELALWHSTNDDGTATIYFAGFIVYLIGTIDVLKMHARLKNT